MKPKLIYAFRHGKAKYHQGKVEYGKAFDLTKEGIKEVKESSRLLTNLFDDSSKSIIISSPFGRCIHTGKIIYKILQNQLKQNIDFMILNDLEEVINFEWRLFEPLMTGGSVEFSNKKFQIDNKITNINELAYPQYFVNSCQSKINFSLLPDVPNEYVQRINQFESFLSATRRFIDCLLELRNKKIDDIDDIIIITHDGLLLFINCLINMYTKSINPGDYVDLLLTDEGLFVVEQKTLKLINVVEAFEKLTSN